MKAKACWVAKETKNGWRLTLSIGNRDYLVRGLLLGSFADAKRAVYDLNCVFVHSAACKCKDKDNLIFRMKTWRMTA